MLEIPDVPKILLDNAPRVKETTGREVLCIVMYLSEEGGRKKKKVPRRPSEDARKATSDFTQ